MKFLKKNCLFITFIITLLAALSCIIRAEILGAMLCPFCWYMRIFLFPLPILLAIAAYKKDYNIIPYVTTLSVFGAFFALTLFIRLMDITSVIPTCPFQGMCKAALAAKEQLPPLFMPIIMFSVFAITFVLLTIGRKKDGE
jgi:disulfide bond formation protein DsbB